MNLDLNIYNIFDLLKTSYKNIDFRSAIYYKDHNWHRILTILRFSNETKPVLEKKYKDLDLKRYETGNFKLQHEILEITKWEDKLFELYDEIHEDIEIYNIDEFCFDNGKYHEFQSSFLDEFKCNFSIPSRWFFFTEEEVKNHNLINFYYNISDKNEHHNQFNKFLNDEIKVLGEDNIYNVLNRTLQLHGYGSQNSLFISIAFPIYMKIIDLNNLQDILSGKVQFHETFEETTIFFRIYSNPNYHENSLEGWEKIILSKDESNTKEINNGIFETIFSLDFNKYDCDPIFEIRAFWEKLPKIYLLDFQKPFDTSRYQQFFEDLAPEETEEQEEIENLDLSESFWANIHPSITRVSRRLFVDRHYADAVFSAFKEVNIRVKKIIKNKIEEELDGKSLMFKAFNLKDPIIQLSDCSTETEKDIQEGYMHLFAGSMQGIRNPKAHENLVIEKKRAIHFLYLASLLMYKIDESD